MLKKFTIVIISAFLLAGCADGFKGYFKKSANNRWIDTKGFHGGKRKPLYNKKYINVAKRNVLDENYDEEDEELELDDTFEGRNPTKSNREMYRNMLKADAKRKSRQRLAQYKARGIDPYEAEDEYPSLNRANERVSRVKQDENYEMQKELAEIKSMLKSAKEDLTKYKCPIEDNKSKASPNPHVKKSGNKGSVSSKKNGADLKDKFISEEDDYKQINSTIKVPEDTDSNPI